MEIKIKMKTQTHLKRMKGSGCRGKSYTYSLYLKCELKCCAMI